MATSTLSTDTRGRPDGRAARGSVPRRIGVFALGFVLNILGAAAWLLSVLLTAPLMLAGVWVWSREFPWAERLLTRLRGWADTLWGRAKAHPVRWGLSTAASLGVTGTAYWLLMA